MSKNTLDNPLKERDLQRDIDAVSRIDAVPTILEVVCRTTGMGFAAVARVTDDRWIACKVLDNIDFGLEAGGELMVETTICHEIRQSREPVIIDNVDEDSVYCNHATPAKYGFKSYISMPIIKNGQFFGTLCAIDPRPARLKNPETIGMFKLFAELIASHLVNADDLNSSRFDLKTSQHDLEETQKDLAVSNAALVAEQELSELREQFIAVLGHDLRNPLAGISGGLRLLQKEQPAERRKLLFEMLEGSVVRMAVLIDNVLDFAHGRLGAGIPLDLRPNILLGPILEHVVSELRLGTSDRVIKTDIALPVAIKCDPSRIAQLVSNLVGNALTHGAAENPITIHADDTDGVLTIWVANGDTPIPAAAMERLFHPFFRGEVRSSQQGLGLGLHIASEIAKAHGGTLVATSTSEETRFTFQMPVAGI